VKSRANRKPAIPARFPKDNGGRQTCEQRMNETFDAAIVGAGPAGISAACILADKGVKTIVFERGEFPGSKNMSGGVLYGSSLARILPDYADRNCPIERTIVDSRVWCLSKDGGYSLGYRDKIFSNERKYNAFTVGRAKFDRWFADQASAKGALVVCSTVVTDLLRDHAGRVIGVNTDRADGEVRARVVLLADGLNSPLAAKTGFRPEPRPEDVALAVKEVVILPEDTISDRFNVGPDQGATIDIIGDPTMGMDGVAVIYTNRSSISLCIGANVAHLSKRKIRPVDMLESFKEHPMTAPLIVGGKPVEYTAHWLPEGGYDAIPRLHGDGYLIAGDSGMLFNTLHREGSNLAMTSGRFAAEAIVEALEKGDFSRRGLRGYTSRLEESYVLKDLKKYRKFNSFLFNHNELFATMPELVAQAAREMLTVDAIPKKQKQKAIWRKIRGSITLMGALRLLRDGWRGLR
jgi:electron transfer flavoprotein-quinone oxidoreductase